MNKKKRKLLLIVLISLISLVTVTGVVWNMTSQSGIQGWESTIIQCSTNQDCINYLRNNGISEENINNVDFDCKEVCYFKPK